MVKLNVLELLEKQGRTKYWLYKQETGQDKILAL